jgi:vesicle transport through interaction with t-SNAREs 1
MSNPLDTDVGSELFSSYEAELKLVQADLNQRLDQIAESSGEQRKAAVRQAERALDEANELVRNPLFLELWPMTSYELTLPVAMQLDQMRMEKQNIPSATRSKVNIRFRNYSSDVDELKRKLKSLSDDRKALFGDRYMDEPNALDQHVEQRQQLLSGTERLERSSARLQDSHRVALETEDIGRGTLADLHQQRETIEHTRMGLHQSEGYVDTSVKTLKGMARRYYIHLRSSLLTRSI